MVLLWARMAALFPQWESLYGNVDGTGISAWTSSLAEFTEAEIGGAIKAAELYEGKYLPSYPEFRAMCVAARTDMQSAANTQKLLDARKSGDVMGHFAKHANSEVAKRELARMEAIARGEEVETFSQSYHNCGLGKRWPGRFESRA